MRIALTTPTSWPRVRRGVERFFDELAAYLASRGHDVTLITAHRGPRRVVRERGFTTILHRRWWHPALARAGILEFHAFFATLLPSLLRGRYDVVLCGTFLDAYAAVLARRRTGTPCVALVGAITPPVQYFRSISMGGAVHRRAVRRADEVLVVSGYVQRYVEERFGRGGRRIPVPVDLDRFPLVERRDPERPVILCCAALEDHRKGGAVLFRAFDRVKRAMPAARLRIAQDVSAETQARLLALVGEEARADVAFSGVGDPADLPAVYGAASVCVLPSRWEVFGMVLLEAMATGTPAVGTRDGAIPELVTDEVGRLFDPGPLDGAAPSDDAALARAILEAIELSRDPLTAPRCRRHAEAYGWGRLGPSYESLLREVAGRRGAAGRGAARRAAE